MTKTLQTVLLVDDDPNIRTIAQMSLSVVGGLTVTLVSSGAEALSVAARLMPDVILLDVMMPEMDGPATLHALRQEPSLTRVPVIFLTGEAQSAEHARLLSLGAQGVIPKPFDPMTIADQIRSIVVGVVSSN